MTALTALLLLLPTQDRLPETDRIAVQQFDAGAAADGLMEMVRASVEKPNKPLRLLVTFTVKPDREQDFLDLFAMSTEKTRTESGNITYHMSKIADDDGSPTYVLFETWKSADDLDSHLRTDYLVRVLTELEEIAENVDIKVMTPVLQKQHRKPSMKKAA